MEKFGLFTNSLKRRWRRPIKRLFGKKYIRDRFSFELHASHGFGAYICGEETALLESLEGKKDSLDSNLRFQQVMAFTENQLPLTTLRRLRQFHG